MEFSVRRPSSPNTYSYVREENSVSMRKLVEIYSLFTYMYYQPNSCNTHAEREWAGGTFLRQWKKTPPAHAQRVYLEERSEGSLHRISFSVCPEYQNTKIFHVGSKIRVSTWSHLSVIPPLRIPIPTSNLVFYSKFVSNTKNYFPPQQ